MPTIQKIFLLDMSPQKFLDACTPEELIEVELLISSPQYQSIIHNHIKQYGNESSNLQTEQSDGDQAIPPRFE